MQNQRMVKNFHVFPENAAKYYFKFSSNEEVFAGSCLNCFKICLFCLMNSNQTKMLICHTDVFENNCFILLEILQFEIVIHLKGY